ncbi:MAG: hypothetical protein ACT4QA_20115, partial [Panacagrimonas sp.]
VSREASRIEGTPGTSIRGIAAQSAPLSRRYHSVRTDFILMHYRTASQVVPRVSKEHPEGGEVRAGCGRCQ